MSSIIRVFRGMVMFMGLCGRKFHIGNVGPVPKDFVPNVVRISKLMESRVGCIFTYLN